MSKPSKTPNRVSINPRDPGYLKRGERGKYRIVFNGEPLKDVITADAQTGYVKRNRRTPGGRYVVEGDYIATEELHGTVEIRTKE